MKQLTKAEEEVMQILWKMKEGMIKDILEGFTNKQPAYNTVATVLKVLKNKGVVDYRKVGNVYVYYPVITKEEYSSFQMKHLLKNYFGGSFTRLAAFFAKDNDMSLEDLEAMLKEADTQHLK
ncbi:BlaI/MecI/CopY family transcriptional regulator [Carboxylicivirga mesophila]|uniref:BlaI/MecI/CopY family transcriptional regulator n=1 Tax=Carboxylicivirga mesophila TaxID=1166478 RepID=A0ABS5KAI8_9BACT|nr:BlaI/MecI/CopY family transcriptional regulator [Carboxylicivirga mesophila]MBS2212025.1 BlaI/MecI/CopY family transcriptional regulator [Carboxylicivirga mesophila]